MEFEILVLVGLELLLIFEKAGPFQYSLRPVNLKGMTFFHGKKEKEQERQSNGRCLFPQSWLLSCSKVVVLCCGGDTERGR